MRSVDYDVCSVQVKIVNEKKQLSNQKIPIPQNDIREILSEIDELDKAILGIEKSNIERKIKIAEHKSKRVCLIRLKTMRVCIPITELGELRSQLMEPIYNDYADCQIAAAKESNKDAECEAILGRNEKNNEYEQAKVILDEYNNWAAAVKKQKEALRTEEALKKANEFYQKVKAEEDLYNSEIKKIVTVFSAIMPDLACFAGCRTRELYPDIVASLENKRRHLKAYLYRNKDVLDDLKEIPSFPDLETMRADFDMEQDGMEEDDVNAGIPEEFKGFIEKLRKWGKNLDNGNCEEELYSIWDQDKASSAFTFFYNSAKEARKDPSVTQEKEENIEETTRMYRTEAKKIGNRILLYEKHWSYARLFCMAYPIVKEIDEYPEGEMDADWCTTISERLYQLLENYNKESDKYRFQWISYNDEECIESESIKVDFVAGEARWPGLYLCCEDDNYLKRLICVTPGSILDV